MPKSRSSRRRKPTPSTPPKPKPSPRWLAPAGLGLIGFGILLIILTYLVPGFPGGNWNLIIGFVFMAAGLGLLSQWR